MENLNQVTEVKTKEFPGILGGIFLLVISFILIFIVSFICSFGIGVYFGVNYATEPNLNDIIVNYINSHLNIINLISSLVGYLLVMLIITKKKKESLKEILKKGEFPKGKIWLFLTLGLIFLSIFSGSLTDIIMQKTNINVTQEINNMSRAIKGVSGIVFAIIIAPFFEEIIFRGTILDGFLKNYNTKFALIMSALMFSIYHFNLIQIIPTFILGLILGYIYIKTKSVRTLIICHIIYNVLPVISMVILNEKRSVDSLKNNYIFLIFSLIVIIFSFNYVFIKLNTENK